MPCYAIPCSAEPFSAEFAECNLPFRRVIVVGSRYDQREATRGSHGLSTYLIYAYACTSVTRGIPSGLARLQLYLTCSLALRLHRYPSGGKTILPGRLRHQIGEIRCDDMIRTWGLCSSALEGDNYCLTEPFNIEGPINTVQYPRSITTKPTPIRQAEHSDNSTNVVTNHGHVYTESVPHTCSSQIITSPIIITVRLHPSVENNHHSSTASAPGCATDSQG